MKCFGLHRSKKGWSRRFAGARNTFCTGNRMKIWAQREEGCKISHSYMIFGLLLMYLRVWCFFKCQNLQYADKLYSLQLFKLMIKNIRYQLQNMWAHSSSNFF